MDITGHLGSCGGGSFCLNHGSPFLATSALFGKYGWIEILNRDPKTNVSSKPMFWGEWDS